jgi:hypothetical protein
MNDEPHDDGGNRDAALDFEQADLGADAGRALGCAHCGVPIGSEYYTVGDSIFCPRCHEGALTLLARGPGLVGHGRAAIFGLGAAAGGAVLWAVVTRVTGYELGIIAIAVGWLVGVAVRAGSGGRGGAVSQGLAVVLTYLAIVSTYVPLILDTWRATPVEQLMDEDGMESGQAGGTVEGAVVDEDEDAAARTDFAAVGDAASESALPVDEQGRLRIDAAMVGAALLVALALPFMMGFENAIGLLIIGIALWEAWRQSRRVRIAVAGPFRVGSQGTG